MTPETVAGGLAFPESPRWHDGALWFSDQHDRRVCRLDPAGGAVETVLEVPEQPSGLGWLPDGDLLVVSMRDRRLLRWDGTRLAMHADLSAVASWHCNDMVVDAQGRAYVGNFGFDVDGGAPDAPATLAIVEPDGAVRPGPGDLRFPNGSVLTADGRTLVVAETTIGRLTAFAVEPDGGLGGRRRFAELSGLVPDGICLDADGAVWVASPVGDAVVRVLDGGAVTDRVETPGRRPFACMLGGDDRRTLFLCTAPDFSPERTVALRDGRIEAVRVAVAGAGLP